MLGKERFADCGEGNETRFFVNVGKNEKKALAAASREFLDLLLEKKRTRPNARAWQGNRHKTDAFKKCLRHNNFPNFPPSRDSAYN